MPKYLKIGNEKHPAHPIGDRFVVLLPARPYTNGLPCLVLIDWDGSLVLKSAKGAGGLMVLPESWGALEPGDITQPSEFTGGGLIDE